ncbi:MAG: hypothetical protein K9N35_00640 [Candidatus Marinimicrobia bacterium]|nr:hypothetical protein [Candidatus Neomarinimicrobiota bacterium]
MNSIEKLNVFNRSVLLRRSVKPNNPKDTLILLHGYGADEYDLMGLAPYFDSDFQVLSIRGPGSTGFGGASWFDIEMKSNGDLRFDFEQARESALGVLKIISELQATGLITNQKIILGGFSQGATIANLVTLFKPEILKALLIMSGRLADELGDLITGSEKFKDLPVFAGHGTFDNVIPIEFGRKIVLFWSKLPVLLEHHEYAMGHEISQDELGHIQHWLTKING